MKRDFLMMIAQLDIKKRIFKMRNSDLKKRGIHICTKNFILHPFSLKDLEKMGSDRVRLGLKSALNSYN